MSPTKFYDARKVTVVLGGIPIKDGLADPFIELTPRGPSFEDDISVDGTPVRYATNESRWDGTMTLKGHSEEIILLSALHGVDKQVGNGAGVGPFMVKDGSGTSLFASDITWLIQAPPKAFGKTLPDVVINFTVIEKTPLGMLAGGN